MVKVNFYEQVEDSLLKFAVIVSRYQGQWVFCKHKKRCTYECPGGHREENEPIEQTARRELWEETGAESFTLDKIGVYSVDDGQEESFGMLYYADIIRMGELPPLEIERIELFDELPKNWTYPFIQPYLLAKVKEMKRIE